MNPKICGWHFRRTRRKLTSVRIDFSSKISQNLQMQIFLILLTAPTVKVQFRPYGIEQGIMYYIMGTSSRSYYSTQQLSGSDCWENASFLEADNLQIARPERGMILVPLVQYLLSDTNSKMDGWEGPIRWSAIQYSRESLIIETSNTGRETLWWLRWLPKH